MVLWGLSIQSTRNHEIYILLSFHFLFWYQDTTSNCLPQVQIHKCKAYTLDVLGVLIFKLLPLCLCSQWSPSAINTVPVRASQRLVHPVFLYLIPLIFQVQWCSAKVGSWSNYLIHLDFKPVEQTWPGLTMPHSPSWIPRTCALFVMISSGKIWIKISQSAGSRENSESVRIGLWCFSISF